MDDDDADTLVRKSGYRDVDQSEAILPLLLLPHCVLCGMADPVGRRQCRDGTLTDVRKRHLSALCWHCRLKH